MHAYRDQYAQLFHDGRNVVLIAISVDPADTLGAWARDDEFQYVFASDTGGVIGKRYGATNPKYGLDNRNLFVVGPDGKIAYRATPYFACAALSDGSSALHSGHHVAQNSSSTGCFPTYCPRSTDFPSRSTTVTSGALVPRGKPTSCPARPTGRTSVDTTARVNNR